MKDRDKAYRVYIENSGEKAAEDDQDEKSHASEADEEPEGEPQDPAAEEDGSADGAADEQDWKAMYEEEREKRLRAVAELKNFRRRANERQARQRQFANETLLSDILGVLDNFDQALCSLDAEECSAETIMQGVEMIHRQLQELTERHGVSEIEAEGVRFDPNFHEAIERVETDDVPEMTVVEVASPGYMLHDRVLRPARVRVAVSPDNA